MDLQCGSGILAIYDHYSDESGDVRNIDLNVTIQACSIAGAYTNIAEISGGNLPTGSPGDDADSTPDTNPTNDPPQEDDSDTETITVVNGL